MVHNQIVRQPGPGMSPRQMHDINVIGLAPAALRLREVAQHPHDRDPRLGRHLRLRAPGAAVLRRGDEPPLPAPHALPARRRRDRELLRDLLAPPAARDLHDAPLPARDRAGGEHPDHALPVAAGAAHLPRLRPAAPVRPRAGRARRARGRGQEPGARRRERGGARHDRPDPHDPAGGQADPAAGLAAVRPGGERRPPRGPARVLRRLPAPAPLRPRRGHAPAGGGGRLPAALHDGGRGGRLRRPSTPAAGCSPRCGS